MGKSDEALQRLSPVENISIGLAAGSGQLTNFHFRTNNFMF
jgi:hypothetical protein